MDGWISVMFKCVISSGSGAVCLAHCDGSSTWLEVPLLIKAVTSLGNGSEEGRYETQTNIPLQYIFGHVIMILVKAFSFHCFSLHRLELHLVGGFNDESKTSHKLSLTILGIGP